ncbi:MAG: UDP-N-acetylmuramoyl-L-alanyl-D-glutamate--2,6-diaminopimelate ligase, partial [Nostocales cyanobacterium]
MKLRDLLAVVDGLEYPNVGDIEVKGIQTNSHACGVGDLFIGIPGTRVDGGEFWPSALAAGAVAAIVSQDAIAKKSPGAADVVISTTDLNRVCAQVAAAFYGYPGQKLKMVGVTGTNGKTTTTHLIEYFLTKANLATALLGTLYTRWPGFSQTAAFTT